MDLDPNMLPTERGLGVQWNTAEDAFSIKYKPRDNVFKRRGLSKAVSSVFDPFGFIGPVILTARIILQDQCRRKKDLDEHLEEKQPSKMAQLDD